MSVAHAEDRSAFAPSLHERLAAALDGPRVLKELASSAARDLLREQKPTAVAVERVHFGSRLGIVVEYAIRDRSHRRPPIRLFGQIPASDPAAMFQSAMRKLEARDPTSRAGNRVPLIFSRALGMMFRLPGFDERIDGLALLRASTSGTTTSSPSEMPPTAMTGQLLAHRLGKRAVLRVAAAEEAPDRASTRIVKLYKRGATAGLLSARIHGTLFDQGFDGAEGHTVPRIVGEATAPERLLMEDVPGQSLARLAGQSRISALGQTGAGLAKLHSSHIDGLHPYAASDDIALLWKWQSFVAPLAPDFAREVEQHISELEERHSDLMPTAVGPIHRDFHDKQVICSGSAVSFTDFDTIRSGDPAQDIGNFIVHLRFSALARGTDAAMEERAFLDGYAKFRRLPSERNTSWHIAATGLRLSLIFHFSEPTGALARRLPFGV